MEVLGAHVDRELLSRWQGWLAPDVQPFFVVSGACFPGEAEERTLAPELRDTYKTWRIEDSLDVVWLDESAFFALSRSARKELVRAQANCRRGAVPTVRGWCDLLDVDVLRSQADGHRFVWWPSLVARDAAHILMRVVGTGLLPSRHRDVASRTWKECAAILPEAKTIAGSFAPSSGSNCFGTVMAAAGVGDDANTWVVEEPFLDWLSASCRPGGGDDDAGTVLVWRNREGRPLHAAVTLGDGWALEKPSQEWSTPRVVLRVEEVIRVNRSVGQRLERQSMK